MGFVLYPLHWFCQEQGMFDVAPTHLSWLHGLFALAAFQMAGLGVLYPEKFSGTVVLLATIFCLGSSLAAGYWWGKRRRRCY